MANGRKRPGNAIDNDNGSPKRSKKSDDDQPKETVILPTPMKSPSDTKEYRVIKLPNGLIALLISDLVEDSNPPWSHSCYYPTENHDKGAKILWGSKYEHFWKGELNHEEKDLEMHQDRQSLSKAAICVGVKAGSINDPENSMGMAHLLEHMIFNGSEKYPHEDNIDKFIWYHGDTSNAYTELERTVYYFIMNPEKLELGMDILQDMLLRPTLDEDCAQREMENVESEFLLKRPNEWLPAYEIIKMTTTKGHPMGFFNWGTVKSLKKSGISKKLKVFHKQYYTVDNMVLTVQSPASLDALQTLVEKCWGTAEKKEGPKKVRSKPTHLRNPYDPSRFGKLYKIPSARDMILIMFHLEPQAWRNATKPMELLSYILSDARKGSLMDFFLEKKWATTMFAGEFPPYRYNYLSKYDSLFHVTIRLLDEGVKNIDKVVQCFYDYLAIFLHDNALEKKAEMWQEMQAIRKNMFDHQGCGIPLHTVTHGSVALLEDDVSTEDLFTGNLISEAYNDEFFQKYVDDIFNSTRDALYIQFINREQLGSTQKTLKYCESIYSVEDIPSSFCAVVDYEELSLAKLERNIYFPTNFTVHPSIIMREIKVAGPPKMLLMYNNQLTLPRSLWKISILSGMKWDFTTSKLMSIWTRYVHLKLYSTIANAEKAGVKIVMDSNSTKCIITVYLHGFSQHLLALSNTLLSQLFSTEDISDVYYDCAKEVELGEYKSLSSSNGDLFSECITRIMTLDIPNDIDTCGKTSALTKAHMKTCIDRFRSQLYFEGFIIGNNSLNEALQFAKDLQPFLSAPIPEKILIKVGSESPKLVLPSSYELCFRVLNIANPNNDNNYIRNIYQLARQTKENIQFCKIASTLMAPYFYNQLRTKQHLGYAVHFIGPRPESKIASFTLHIVSPSSKFSACHLSSKMDEFLADFYHVHLNSMDENTFSAFMDDFLKGRYGKCITTPVTLAQMKNWYLQKIVSCLPASNEGEFYGLSKLSIQLIGNPNEKCKTTNCNNFSWRALENGNPDFRFAAPDDVCKAKSGEKSGQKFFIWNAKEFQDRTSSNR